MILAFYPGAFTGVCDKEMCAFQDNMVKLNDASATVVGISVDSPWANAEFARKYNLEFERDKFVDNIRKGQRFVLYIGIPSLLGLYLSAEHLISTIFSEELLWSLM